MVEAGRADAGMTRDAGSETKRTDGAVFPEDGSKPMMDASVGRKRGSSPERIANFLGVIPDSGKSGVSGPKIGINATDLFYLATWYEPQPAAPTGALLRVPLGGGEPVRMTTIRGDGTESPHVLAVTARGVVTTEAAADDAGSTVILRVPFDGSSPAVVAAANGIVNALVADDENIYFADGEATKSVALRGGTVHILAAQTPFTLGLGGQTLYLANLETQTISSVPVTGGSVTVLATDTESPFHPIPCGPNLCWLSGGSGPQSVGSLKQLAPGSSPVTLAEGVGSPPDLVFDGKSFFMPAGRFGLGVARVPAGGGTPMEIYPAYMGVTDLALDEDCLYWSSISGVDRISRSVADVATAF